MSASEIHVGDIGTAIEVTVQDDGVVVDVSSATTRELIFRKPGGVATTRPAVFATDGTDGKLRYVTVAGDLDRVGTWQLQVHVVMPTVEWRSDVATFAVYDNLTA